MEALVTDGLVKHIGICNFGTSLLRDLLSYAKIRPAVLQVESHPFLVQEKLLRYCKQERIAFTAFSPLGAASYYSLGMAGTIGVIAGQSNRSVHRSGERQVGGSGSASLGHSARNVSHPKDINAGTHGREPEHLRLRTVR